MALGAATERYLGNKREGESNADAECDDMMNMADEVAPSNAIPPSHPREKENSQDMYDDRSNNTQKIRFIFLHCSPWVFCHQKFDEALTFFAGLW